MTKYQIDAHSCLKACLNAGLSPATLAADPEAIKQLLSACDYMLSPLDVINGQVIPIDKTDRPRELRWALEALRGKGTK